MESCFLVDGMFNEFGSDGCRELGRDGKVGK